MSQKRKTVRHLPEEVTEEIIKLAWADTIPFETIYHEYGLRETEVQTFMRIHQCEKTYVRWRKRVETRRRSTSKHGSYSCKTGFRL